MRPFYSGVWVGGGGALRATALGMRESNEK